MNNVPRYDFEAFGEVFDEIEGLLKTKNVIVAVEGKSASGKTTLSQELKKRFDCAVFHTDDFFLRAEQRTDERMNEIGGNFDRERFFSEVLTSVCRGEDVSYRPFDCSSFTLKEAVFVPASRLTVIEGAYCLHPDFPHYYDISVFIDISQDLQRQRILKRNTFEKAQRFFGEWIVKENAYFEAFKIKEKCDFNICIPTK